MTTAFEELIYSNVWDSRFNLPTVASAANPHIYCAYAVRVLEALDDQTPKDLMGSETIKLTYAGFLTKCLPEPGLLTTFPGERIASYDDVLGAAFFSSAFAADCLIYLEKHDGVYWETEGASWEIEKKNIYRFPLLTPILRSRSGFRMGIVSQLQYIAALMGQLWTAKDNETDGHLFFWLSFPAMRKYSLVSPFIEIWSRHWIGRGYTPKSIFTQHYLMECPWFGKWARDDYK